MNGIAVEVNDLVSFVCDVFECLTEISARDRSVITQVDVQSQSVELRIISSKALNKQLRVPVRQLRFYAKGFSPSGRLLDE